MKFILKTLLVAVFCLVVAVMVFVPLSGFRREGVNPDLILSEFVDLSNEIVIGYVADAFVFVGGGYAIYDIRLAEDEPDFFLNNDFVQKYYDADSDFVDEYFKDVMLNLHPSPEKVVPSDFRPVCILSKNVGEREARVFLGDRADPRRAILLVMIP